MKFATVAWLRRSIGFFFFFLGFIKMQNRFFSTDFSPWKRKIFVHLTPSVFFPLIHRLISIATGKYFWPRDKKFENFSNLSISIKLLIFGIIERSRKEYLESEVIRAKAFKKCSHVWAR